MKCLIHGKEVEAKVIENIGYTSHGYAKCVNYNNEEYVIVKKGSIWRTLEPKEKLRTWSLYIGQ